MRKYKNNLIEHSRMPGAVLQPSSAKHDSDHSRLHTPMTSLAEDGRRRAPDAEATRPGQSALGRIRCYFMDIRKRIKDPLLGFGWAGYVCTAILIALISALVAGIELRYELLKLILATLGVDAMMYFVFRLVYVGFALFGVSVSLSTGVAILVAFRIAPYRVHALLQLLLFLLCTAWPIVSIEGYLAVGRTSFSLNFYVFQLLEVFGIVLIGSAVIFLSRSRFVAVMWALAVALALANAVWIQNTGSNPPGTITLFRAFDFYHYTSLSMAFDVFTMGSLLLWAILDRRKILPAQMCHSCEYDLAGLPGDAICPECGRKEALVSIPRGI